MSGRAVAAVLALLLATAVSAPLTPAHAAMPDAEARMLGHINGARSSNGLGALSPHDTLTGVARSWAGQMARDYEAGGSRQGALRHNPSMTGQLPAGYRRAGENVGYTVLSGGSHNKLVDRLHEAYMGSSGHRANILGEFDRVGVGLVVADDGTMWSAVVFMLEGASEPEPEPEPEAGSEPESAERATEAKSASGPSPGRGSGSGSSDGGPSASQQEPAPEPAPPPAPPSSEDLFGAGWPEGYLSGDPDAAKGLLGSLRGVRVVVSLLPGPRPGGGMSRPVIPVASR